MMGGGSAQYSWYNVLKEVNQIQMSDKTDWGVVQEHYVD